MFQPIYRFLKYVFITNFNTDHISARKSKRLSDESFKSSATSDNSLAPALNHIVFGTIKKFDGQYLKQDKVTFNRKNLVNIYIAYEINLWPFI